MLVSGKRTKAAKIAWILVGLVLSFSVTAFCLSGRGTLNNFYNVGEVYEISHAYFDTYAQQANGHQELSGEVILDNGEYAYGMTVERNQNKWKFFYINLSKVNAVNLQAVVHFIRVENGAAVGEEVRTFSLTEGANWTDVPKNSFNTVSISIQGAPGDSYCVKKMELRRTEAVFSWKAAAKFFLISYGIYSLVVCLLLCVLKKSNLKCRPYRWMEALQEFYISVARRLYDSVSKAPWLMKRRRCIRTILLSLMFVYNSIVEMQGTYNTQFKYHVLIYALLIGLTAVFTIEPRLEKQNWNHALAWSWLALWGMACVSDFLVSKTYQFMGYVMVFIVGFFFFVWNNMEKPQEMTEDFARAVHVFFVYVIVLCCLFRPDTGNARYLGFSWNPSIFALYLGVIWVVILGEVEQGIRARKPIIKMLPYIIEGCLNAGLCWKTQSAGPLLCMAAIAFVWFLKMLWHTRKTRTRGKVLAAVFLFFLLLVPAYSAMDWSLKTIPYTLGKPIAFENDQVWAYKDWGMVAHAANLKEKFAETRLGQKFARNSISDILGARDYYYRTYLRKMNLFGHTKNPIMWGHRRLPHNALLGIAYRYGVFAIVPYILMLGATLVRTFKHSNKNVKYAGMPFWMCLISILMSMSDNIEQPFVWLPWIALYLMMGAVFADREEADLDRFVMQTTERGENADAYIRELRDDDL